uniref:HP domain-containing protein n=1 Tax=Oryza meridionalis TaxID=40149 RepID=A0A0E0D0S8_9ORYZ
MEIHFRRSFHFFSECAQRVDLRVQVMVDQLRGHQHWLLFHLHSTHLPKRIRPKSSDGGPTQRASAMAALTSAFNPSAKPKSPPPRAGQGSQRAAAVAALSNVLTAEGSSQSPRIGDADTAELTPSAASPLSEGASEFSADKDAPGDGALSEGGRTEPDVSVEQTANENGGETTFSYDRLISKSTNPVRGIDYKRRETYLSDSEFQTVFGITKEEFYQQPGAANTAMPPTTHRASNRHSLHIFSSLSLLCALRYEWHDTTPSPPPGSRSDDSTTKLRRPSSRPLPISSIRMLSSVRVSANGGVSPAMAVTTWNFMSRTHSATWHGSRGQCRLLGREDGTEPDDEAGVRRPVSLPSQRVPTRQVHRLWMQTDRPMNLLIC